MEKIVGLVSFGIVVALIAPILSCFLGAFSAWMVGLVFEKEIMDFLSRVGIQTAGLSMWQLGAALGFIGGYLKTTVYEKK